MGSLASLPARPFLGSTIPIFFFLSTWLLAEASPARIRMGKLNLCMFALAAGSRWPWKFF
jgi:hypothetical protein